MADRSEMESMLLSAPIGDVSGSLVSVLCVEATKKTQKVIDEALSAGDDHGNRSSAAAGALCRLPGTQLRISPYTTIDTIRSFLQEQETGASLSLEDHFAGADATQLKKKKNNKSLANAHFFAVGMPSSSSEVAEAFLPLQNTTTLHDVMVSGHTLRLSDVANADASEQTVLLVYTSESEYGVDGEDLLLCAICAACCACLVGLCATGASKAASKKNKFNEQQQQQQYNSNMNSTLPNQNYYGGNVPGAPQYSYGAPPQQYPVSYPVAQPAYYNYSGDPRYAQPSASAAPPAPYYYTQPPNQQQGPPHVNNYVAPASGPPPL
ncbi:hypothetical protein JKF63_04579 [Porcisia hertigi]|uniref:Uncharacterized protein n=1 Tax=Porcisia hertigi TaxID=2761500 RepID=A0A836IPT1_9TRYP|nr:hypothetical protein JKF63_04579 [Porcisia hertigi]